MSNIDASIATRFTQVSGRVQRASLNPHRSRRAFRQTLINNAVVCAAFLFLIAIVLGIL